MKVLKFVFFIALLSITTIAFAEEDSKEEKLEMTFFGKKAGVEKYKVTSSSNDKLEVNSEGKFLFVKGKFKLNMSLKTKLLFHKKTYRPIKYQLSALVNKVKKKVTVEFKKKVAEVVIENKWGTVGQPKSIPIHEDTLILDSNVLNHLTFIVKKYDLKKGGKQDFHIFVPQLMREYSISIEYKGLEKVNVGDATYKLGRLFLSMVDVGVSLWVDKNKRLIKFVSPLQGLCVTLLGYKGKKVTPDKKVVKKKNYKSENVKFKNGEVELAGTITIPKGAKKRYPAVVLISGSGPQDRDENVPNMGVKWNIFKDIADKLSSNGIIVLRYDDRGVGKSKGNFARAKLSDFVKDVIAALNYLKTRPEVIKRKIGLIGHSEGGIIGPIVAKRRKGLKAIVLMAGTARPLDKIILEQVKARLEENKTPKDELDEALKKQREFIKKVKESKTNWIKFEGKKRFIGWYKQHFKHNPIWTIKKVKSSILILQGMKDKQVYPYNAKMLDKALKSVGKKNYDVKYFPNLDHLFMPSKGLLSEYSDPTRRVSKEFLKYLLKWLKKNL